MTEHLTEQLRLAFDRRSGPGHRVAALRRLSEGASREAWSFSLKQPDNHTEQLILKRDPPDAPVMPDDDDNRFGADRGAEAAILDAAFKAGVPAPRLVFTTTSQDGLGEGFIMQALAGETLPQRILRNPELDEARRMLPAQLGAALARLHAVPPDDRPPLRHFALDDHLAAFRKVLDDYGHAQPGYEFALRWLHDHRPADDPSVFVHGDFRMGNVMVGPTGLVGILDWEVGHIGDRYLDLAWPSVRAWRFGRDGTPLAGVGQREDFFAAYEGAGGQTIDRAAVHYWEVLGTLRWGVMCMTIGQRFTSGRERSVEKAVIGRRVAETELDFLNMLQTSRHSLESGIS